MRSYIFLLIFFFPLVTCSQEKKDQVLVLKKVINDESIATFFEEKDTIKVVKNEYLYLIIDDTIKIDDRTIYIIKDDSSANSSALRFIDYKENSNRIIVEITLFNKNVIYSATYRKEDGEIDKLMSGTRFIKSRQKQ